MKISYWKILIIVLIAALVFWVLAVLSQKCFGFTVSEETSIVTIIGILSTFVVIGNFTQTQAIKEDINAKINVIEEKQKIIEHTHKETKEMQEEAEKMRNNLTSDWDRYIAENTKQKKQYDPLDVIDAKERLKGKERELIEIFDFLAEKYLVIDLDSANNREKIQVLNQAKEKTEKALKILNELITKYEKAYKKNVKK